MIISVLIAWCPFHLVVKYFSHYINSLKYTSSSVLGDSKLDLMVGLPECSLLGELLSIMK